MEHGGNFMSNKVMEFYSKAVKDEQFVKSLEKFKTENGTEKTEAIKKVVLPYAKKLGYSFTEDELLHNLTEEELSQIAGGGWLWSSLVAATTTLVGFAGFGGGEAPPAQQPSQSTVRQQENNNTEQSIVARSEFTDNADGTCTLKSMDKTISGAVTIPSEVNGKPITNIGEFAFQHCAGITTLAIPASVQVIGDSAFSQCFGITSITFKSGSRLHTIGSSAFAGCARVKSLNIPNGVTEINGSTFFACSDLEEIYIPKTVTSIKSNAFSGCKNLKRVHIPAHAKISKTILFPAEYLDLPEGCTVEYY